MPHLSIYFIMTLSDATRAQRVKGWTDQKSRGKSKLEKARNPHDINVGKAMIAEANSALERLGALEAQVRDEKKTTTPKRKVTGKEKDEPKTSATTKNETGSLGI